VEENWIHHRVTKEIIEEYLQDFLNKDIDTIIMGCTHYPVLKQVIQEVVGDKITLVDSAESIARELKKLYSAKSVQKISGKYNFFVSDNPEKFKILGRQILGEELDRVEKVFFSDAWVMDTFEK